MEESEEGLASSLHSPPLTMFGSGVPSSPLAAPLTGRASPPRHEAIQRQPRAIVGSRAPQQAPHDLNGDGGAHVDPPVEPDAVVWGTTVSTGACERAMVLFLDSFRVEGDLDMDDVAELYGEDEDSNEALDAIALPYYLRQLRQVPHTGQYRLAVDMHHVWDVDQTLYTWLQRYPLAAIPIFDSVVNAKLLEVNPGFTPQRDVHVCLFHLRHETLMRELDPKDIEKLVCIQGMVIRISGIIPELVKAFFKCTECHKSVLVAADRGFIAEPVACPNNPCGKRGTMRVIYNRCFFTDKQVIKVQETPDSIPEGETPHTVSAVAYGDMVDVARPGDRVDITGVYRASGVRDNPRMRRLSSVYRTYVDVIHFQKASHSALEGGAAGALGGPLGPDDTAPTSEYHDVFAAAAGRHFTPTKVAQFETMAQAPDIYERLAKSIARSIWQLDDVKKGLLCQLFGGTTKILRDGKFRGEINVLLCGDPGTSKSQLLRYVHKLAPRGVYTSGKGSSAVGLTAHVTKDPDTGQAALESGALVLSDRGVCCIDEFDKMSDHTRSILHEAMEQQTVSIAKAGIICTLNARTSILASANPIESKYNPNLSVVENIQLPPTLLSRFDLIYLVLDKPNRASDSRLARHIISLYYEEPVREDADIVDLQTLREYIAYAKTHINPILSDEAALRLVEGYVAMRRLGGNRRTITATPRQLESLVRLSEAGARIRLSSVVTVEMVDEALRLMEVALQQAAIDPFTGTIDMDLITTGRSATSRGRLAAMVDAVARLMAQAPGSLTFNEIRDHMSEQSDVTIPRSELRDALMQLVEEGELAVTGARSRNPTYTRIN